MIGDQKGARNDLKLPQALKKAVRRAAFEESRLAYEERRVDLARWAAEQLLAGVPHPNILGQLELRILEAARRNALRSG